MGKSHQQWVEPPIDKEDSTLSPAKEVLKSLIFHVKYLILILVLVTSKYIEIWYCTELWLFKNNEFSVSTYIGMY